MRHWIRRTVAAVALALALLIGSRALAQCGGLRIDWWSADGGGGSAAGGAFALAGSAGQSDAGAMAGGPFRLAGGFWAATGRAADGKLYLPLVAR